MTLICKKLGKRAPCATAHTALPGAPAVSKAEIAAKAEESGLSSETISHLAAIYGSRYIELLKYAAEEERLGNAISPGAPDILAQIKHAIIEESALSVNDFMLRRSFLGLSRGQGLDAVETVAVEMGARLGWSRAEIQQQVEVYRGTAALGQHFREQEP